MIKKIEVVNQNQANYFFCEDVLFDTFFAHFLSWEEEQDIIVFDANNNQKQIIRFWEGGSDHPDWLFYHCSTKVSSLLAMSFAEGDSLLLDVNDCGLVATGLKRLLCRHYLRHLISTYVPVLDTWGPTSKSVSERFFREIALAKIVQNPNGPFIFERSTQIVWK